MEYPIERNPSIRDSFSILLPSHALGQYLVIGFHIQCVVHQSHIRQVKRPILQAFITAQTVQNRPEQPLLFIRKSCPVTIARYFTGSARKVTSFCIKFARFLLITKKLSKTVSKASRSSNIRCPSDITDTHSIPCLRWITDRQVLVM